jgi:hypothetical protein
MAAAAASSAGKAAGVTYKYLGRSGLKVSSICLGTMTFGGTDAGLPGNCTKEQAFSLMDAFEAAGGNFVDTANGAFAAGSFFWLVCLPVRAHALPSKRV